VPGKNGHVPITACNSYYNYDPKLAPAVAVAAIFGILTAVHIVQAIIHKKVSVSIKRRFAPCLTLALSVSVG